MLAADSLLLEEIHSTDMEKLPKWRWIQKVSKVVCLFLFHSSFN